MATISTIWKAWNDASLETRAAMVERGILRKCWITEHRYVCPEDLELMKSLPKYDRGPLVIYDFGILHELILVQPCDDEHTDIVTVNMEDWIARMAWYEGSTPSTRRRAFLEHSRHACTAMFAGVEVDRPVAMGGVPHVRRTDPYEPWPVLGQAAEIGSAVSVAAAYFYGATPEREYLRAQVANAFAIANGRPLEVWLRHTGQRDKVLIDNRELAELTRDIVEMEPDVAITLFWDAINPASVDQEKHDAELLMALDCLRAGLEAGGG